MTGQEAAAARVLFDASGRSLVECAVAVAQAYLDGERRIFDLVKGARPYLEDNDKFPSEQAFDRVREVLR